MHITSTHAPNVRSYKNCKSQGRKKKLALLISEKNHCMFISIRRYLTPNSLWYIFKEKSNQRLLINVLVQLGFMTFISKQCFM